MGFNHKSPEKSIAQMALNRFSIAFIAACIPLMAMAAVPTIQDANQTFRRGNNNAALEKINSFLATNPKDAQGRFLKGLILTDLNRLGDAIKVFSDLTEDYPELPEPYNNLAVLYAAQADYERAKHSLEMAIRTHPSYATAHENLGDIYAKMASQAYDKALQLDQSNTSAQTKLALIRELFSPAPHTQEVAKATEPLKGKTKPGTKVAALVQATSASSQPAATTPSDSAAQVVTAKSADTANNVSTPPVTPKPAAQTDPKSAVEQTVHDWAGAWSARDADAYMAFYSEAFKTPRGQDRAAWETERKARVTRPEFIKIDIDRIKIDIKGNTAKVRFQQRYESNIVKDKGRKTLVLTKQGDSWKIVEER